MADEVLKYIVTADDTKARAVFKGLSEDINKTGTATKAASIQGHAGIQELNKLFADTRQQLGSLSSSMSQVGAQTTAGLTTAAEATMKVGAGFEFIGSQGTAAMTALGGPLAIVTGVLTAQATALGTLTTAIIDAGVAFHDVMALMAGRTGETGAALEGLGRDFTQVFASVPQSANEVAEVMAKLHQRFDLTGASLQQVSRMMLDFSRVTGTPVKAAMDSLVDVMSSWDLQAKDMPKLIDMMTVAFQQSGVEIPKMAGYLEGNDAALKQFGFSLVDSIALIATLEKRGVNVQKIMTGMNKAAPAFAEAGIDPQTGFDNAIRMMRELDNEHALLIAKQTFGAKVAVEFADAVRSGAFDAYEMKIALEESAGALELAAARSMTLTDELKLMQHATQALLMPLGSALVSTIEKYTIPAFAVLAFKLAETVYWMEYLAGINPTIPDLDLAKATHTGLRGAAPAMPLAAIAELSGKGPAKRTSPAMSFDEYMSKMRDKGAASRASAAAKEIDPEKFDRDFRTSELRIFETFDRAGDQFDKSWTDRLRGTADRALKALQEEEKVAKELEENNRKAADHTQALQDKLDLISARTAGRTKQESERFGLLEEQRQELRGVTGGDRLIILRTHEREQLALMQKQYDDTFSKIQAQAEGVFDAIFLRGKKGFAGLLDYIKGIFITQLKDAFGKLVASIFAGPRPGGAKGEGGLFGGLFSGISGLFNRQSAGGGGGGFNAGALAGGGGFASRLKAAFGFGGAAATAGVTAGAGTAATAAGELALPTTFSALRPETLGGAGGAAGGSSFFGLSGAQLGAFFTNPFTIAAGIGIAATIAFLKLRKTREEKFRSEILRDFAINVPDNKLLKQIKNIGESFFGKEADKKRFETLRLDNVQGLLLSYATASGQDPSRLPLYQRFYGKGGTADNQRVNISKFNQGGIVPGVGNFDSVPALLTPGEGIFTKEQMARLGGNTYYVDARGSNDPGALEAAVFRAIKSATGQRELVRNTGKGLSRDMGRTDFRKSLF